MIRPRGKVLSRLPRSSVARHPVGATTSHVQPYLVQARTSRIVFSASWYVYYRHPCISSHGPYMSFLSQMPVSPPVSCRIAGGCSTVRTRPSLSWMGISLLLLAIPTAAGMIFPTISAPLEAPRPFYSSSRTAAPAQLDEHPLLSQCILGSAVYMAPIMFN